MGYGLFFVLTLDRLTVLEFNTGRILHFIREYGMIYAKYFLLGDDEMKMSPESSNAAILKELGSRIKQNRIDRQLTQKDFAQKAGISTRTLSAAENGEDIRLDGLIRILRTLDCLENLNVLLPDISFDPESYRRLGKERRRVSRKSRKPDTSLWKWGDEE